MVKPIPLGHPSNESGSRALSLCAIRLAGGSMVTLPADAEPDQIDPGSRIPMELPTLCLSCHTSSDTQSAPEELSQQLADRTSEERFDNTPRLRALSAAASLELPLSEPMS